MRVNDERREIIKGITMLYLVLIELDNGEELTINIRAISAPNAIDGAMAALKALCGGVACESIHATLMEG